MVGDKSLQFVAPESVCAGLVSNLNVDQQNESSQLPSFRETQCQITVLRADFT
jgi:hypothetical protein